MMFFIYFIPQDNGENSCGEELQAIKRDVAEMKRDVAEMKAVITSKKTTGELKYKFKCTIDQELMGAAAYKHQQTLRVYSWEMTS